MKNFLTAALMASTIAAGASHAAHAQSYGNFQAGYDGQGRPAIVANMDDGAIIKLVVQNGSPVLYVYYADWNLSRGDTEGVAIEVVGYGRTMGLAEAVGPHVIATRVDWTFVARMAYGSEAAVVVYDPQSEQMIEADRIDLTGSHRAIEVMLAQ